MTSLELEAEVDRKSGYRYDTLDLTYLASESCVVVSDMELGVQLTSTLTRAG
jgi:hypothetical protein